MCGAEDHALRAGNTHAAPHRPGDRHQQFRRARLSYEKDAAQQFADAVLTGGTRNLAFLETFDATSSIIQDFTGDPDLLSEKIED